MSNVKSKRKKKKKVYSAPQISPELSQQIFDQLTKDVLKDGREYFDDLTPEEQKMLEELEKEHSEINSGSLHTSNSSEPLGQ